jgi:hypothetical protein
MANLIACRDTFYHYLADNLPSLTFHYVRFDKNNIERNELQNNSVNITYHNADPLGAGAISEQLVTIDVLNDDELGAIAQVEQVATLLQKVAFAQLLDYTNATSPVPIGSSKVFWDLKLKFKPVKSDNYFHMSALIHLHHQYV